MTRWGERIAAIAAGLDAAAVETTRASLDYLCLAQLYLHENITLDRPLRRDDLKPQPSGHWGVCPPINAVLAALGPYRRHLTWTDVRVVHGGGHAGPSAMAQAWITGDLADIDTRYTRDHAGLAALCTEFPHLPRLGGEITPLLPGHDHLGGQLGPALAISHGMALDAPDRLVVTLIGDGECETGATAAAWLAAHALAGTGEHGRVLPIVMFNGLRMGGPSLLAGLGTANLTRFLSGLGYRVITTTDPSTTAINAALAEALSGAVPLHDGPSTVLVVTVEKGHGAPATVGGRAIAATPAVHKTPLRAPQTDHAEFAALANWLADYRPGELFTSTGAPVSAITRTLAPATEGVPTLDAPRGCVAASATVADAVRAIGADFGAAMRLVLRNLHSAYGLRVFSPDEAASNRIDVGEPDPSWLVEVLNEELCHAWAQGYQETGRRALVISYEAFAPIVASLLTQQLLARRLAAAAGRPPTPSTVYLLTSLGWNNTYSHANPGLVDIAVACADPGVHIYTPADTARAAAAVTFAVRKLGRTSMVIASKHPMPEHPLDTLDAELRDGYAVWPHIADHEDPQLVLLSAGDIAARELSTAATAIAAARPHARIRYLHIHDLACLGDPGMRPGAIPAQEFTRLIPVNATMLAATTSHPAALYALLGERGCRNPLTVRGWSIAALPLSPPQLLEHAGMDADALTATGVKLLDTFDAEHGVGYWEEIPDAAQA